MQWNIIQSQLPNETEHILNPYYSSLVVKKPVPGNLATILFYPVLRCHNFPLITI